MEFPMAFDSEALRISGNLSENLEKSEPKIKFLKLKVNAP